MGWAGWVRMVILLMRACSADRSIYNITGTNFCLSAHSSTSTTTINSSSVTTSKYGFLPFTYRGLSSTTDQTLTLITLYSTLSLCWKVSLTACPCSPPTTKHWQLILLTNRQQVTFQGKVATCFIRYAPSCLEKYTSPTTHLRGPAQEANPYTSVLSSSIMSMQLTPKSSMFYWLTYLLCEGYWMICSCRDGLALNVGLLSIRECSLCSRLRKYVYILIIFLPLNI